MRADVDRVGRDALLGNSIEISMYRCRRVPQHKPSFEDELVLASAIVVERRWIAMEHAAVDLHDDARMKVDQVAVELADSRVEFHVEVACGQRPGHEPLGFGPSPRAAAA